MKISCDVIRDLLPLYAENLTSEESNHLVAEHLSKCESCQSELLKITKQTVLPPSLNDYNNLKKAKSRDRRYMIIGIASVVLALALIFLIAKPYLPYLYTGDRITLFVDGSVDGEEIIINSENVACNYDRSSQEVHFSESESEKFSVKGDEYGKYTFTIPTESYKIKIELVHTNWWQIDNCKLHFDIDSQSNTLTYAFTDTSGNTDLGTSLAEGGAYTLYFML